MNKLKTYHVLDIWNSYCLNLIASNEDWVGMTKRSMPQKNMLYYSMYRKYKDGGKFVVIEAINYTTFSKIITDFFALAKERIIQGEALNLLNWLGKICARRVERDHRNKSIDFVKTAKQPLVWNEEKQKYCRKIIYYTTDDWCRIGWHKTNLIKNSSVYYFKPTKNLRSGAGFNQQFSSALRKDPALKFKYIYYPLKSSTNDL